MAGKILGFLGNVQTSPTAAEQLPGWVHSHEGEGWSARLFQSYASVVGVVQRRHEAFTEQQTAAVQRREYQPPALDARRRQNKLDAQALSQARARADQVLAEHEAAMAKLKPFDPATDMASVLSRQEMRAHLRSLSDKERNKLLADAPWYQAAALDAPAAELSGLKSAEYNDIYNRALEARYPEAVAAARELREAQRTLDSAFKVAEKQLQHAYQRDMEDPNQPEKQPSKSWV